MTNILNLASLTYSMLSPLHTGFWYLTLLFPSESCIGSILELNTVDSYQLLCDGESSCKKISLWCPYGNEGACNVTNTDRDDSALNDMEIYVDEAYTYDFLALQCEGNGTCENVMVYCEGDKGINDETLKYDSF